VDTFELRTGLVPGEIFVDAPSIHIEATEPVDAESAQGAITVPGIAGVVSLSNEARMIAWKPGGRVKPGHYELQLGNLQTADGRTAGETAAIPFTIVESRASIPVGSAIVAMNRLRVHGDHIERLPSCDRPDGSFIDVTKVLDRRTGAMTVQAFDEDGQPVDFNVVQQQIQEAQRARYGKLHPSLYQRLEQASPDDRFEVALWLRAAALADSARLKSRESGVMSEEEKQHRQDVAKLSEDYARKLAKDDERSYARAEANAPLVYASLTQDQIREIARADEVMALFLHETEGIEDLQNSISIAHADDAQALGATGQGIDVAVWESGPDDTKDLPIAGFFDPGQSATSAHARLVCAVVKNTEPFAPKGFAPNCALYSANSKSLSALAWAVEEAECTVVNQSFHRASEPGSAFLSLDDIYKDWLALHWPYPTIVQAAGNFWNGDSDGIVPPSNEYVNHKGYNSLAVGNHNDAATAMWGTSVFRNPSSASINIAVPTKGFVIDRTRQIVCRSNGTRLSRSRQPTASWSTVLRWQTTRISAPTMSPASTHARTSATMPCSLSASSPTDDGSARGKGFGLSFCAVSGATTSSETAVMSEHRMIRPLVGRLPRTYASACRPAR